MKKVNVKEFIKNHEATIIGVSLGTCIAVGAGIIGYHAGCNNIMKSMDKAIGGNAFDLLMDASVDGVNMVFGSINRNGVDPKNLGELGELILKDGGENIKFTHFLAFGKR